MAPLSWCCHRSFSVYQSSSTMGAPVAKLNPLYIELAPPFACQEEQRIKSRDVNFGSVSIQGFLSCYWMGSAAEGWIPSAELAGSRWTCGRTMPGPLRPPPGSSAVAGFLTLGLPSRWASQADDRCRQGRQRRLRAGPIRCLAVSELRCLRSAMRLSGRRRCQRRGRPSWGERKVDRPRRATNSDHLHGVATGTGQPELASSLAPPSHRVARGQLLGRGCTSDVEFISDPGRLFARRTRMTAIVRSCHGPS